MYLAPSVFIKIHVHVHMHIQCTTCCACMNNFCLKFFLITWRSLTNNSHTEVEKFIEVNTEKLGENKYLCPLSGKKFRGPDFVRKHILNKHKEAINEVKSEVNEKQICSYTYIHIHTRPGFT